MKTIAPGIYKVGDGRYRVVAYFGNSRVNQRRKEKRFPASAGLREMKRWQADVRASFERDGLRVQRDTLAADVPRFMQVMRQRLVRPAHRDNEINSWLPRFGQRRRHTIDTEEIRQQVVAWEADGLAASTINHRLSGLSQLYAVLDGDRAHNPVAGVRRLREPQAKPGDKSPETIQRVFVALEARVTAQNRGWQTLARLKVIALTGMRHFAGHAPGAGPRLRRSRSALRGRCRSWEGWRPARETANAGWCERISSLRQSRGMGTVFAVIGVQVMESGVRKSGRAVLQPVQALALVCNSASSSGHGSG